MNISSKKLLGLVSTFALTVPATAVSALELGVFADAGYVVTDDNQESDRFAIGALDLYANQQIGNKTTAFFELVFEHDGDNFVVDVERYWIKRDFNKAFSLGVGRFHSPLGYWNRNYHHGVLIQDTVSRPAFLDFEDGDAAILPMHVIGLMATGELGAGFSYELSVANSTSYDTSGGLGSGELLLGNVSDASDDKSLFGRVTYAFDAVPLQLGIFGMSNKLVEDSASGIVTAGKDLASTTVWGADLRYERHAFDALAEYYYVDSQDETNGVAGGDGNADAFYVQLGYRLNEHWKLAYRYEDLSLDDNVGYFNVLGTGEYSAHVGVVRYDVDDSNAIMLEYNTKNNDASDDVTEVTVNWSFLMF